MRRLQYRNPRFAVDIPVQVTHGDSSQLARGRDISMEGMKLDLDVASFPYPGGFIQLRDGTSTLEIPFEVRTRTKNSIGVLFQDLSSEQTAAITKVVTYLSRRTNSLSLVVRK
jgi:hypothetical protein